MTDVVLSEVRDRIATITLNRPEARNALSRDLLKALRGAVRDAQASDDVDVLILTGADPAFCAGLDLKELGSGGQSVSETQPTDDTPVAERGPLPPGPKPVIGAVNGAAITGGFELALACDFLVASDRARFADTHARVGITPGWGLSQKLPRLIGPYRAKELSLTGNFLDARTACDWGLVNRVVEPAELMPTALALAAEMAQIDADMLIVQKALIDDGYALSLEDGLALEHERSSRHNAGVTPQMVEERRAAVQARARAQK